MTIVIPSSRHNFNLGAEGPRPADYATIVVTTIDGETYEIGREDVRDVGIRSGTTIIGGAEVGYHRLPLTEDGQAKINRGKEKSDYLSSLMVVGYSYDELKAFFDPFYGKLLPDIGDLVCRNSAEDKGCEFPYCVLNLKCTLSRSFR